MKKMLEIRNGPTTGPVTSILEKQTAYNIVENERENSAEITMYGEIVTNRPKTLWTDKKDDKLYIVLSEFLDDLEKVKERSKLTIRINSPGGELYAGLAIMNRLSEFKGDVITVVDGLAASAASIILQGGKTRKVHKSSMVMVHSASTFLFGYYNEAELNEAFKQLNAANRAAIEAYSQRTNIDKNEIQSILAETKWMTGEEAVNRGFADELIETGNVSMSISKDKTYMIVNGIKMFTERFKTLPTGLKVEDEMVISGREPVVADMMNKNEGGNKKVTVEELKAQHPELIAEIEQMAVTAAKADGEDTQKNDVESAVKAERQRISEIDKIAKVVGNEELLNKAKFETPMTAAELAFEVMKQQAKVGEKFMKDSTKDLKDSGVEGVEALPSGDVTGEMEQEDIAKGAAMIAGIKEGERR